MKSRHFAPLDLGLEDAKCVVLRQVFHTHGWENLDFIVVSKDSKGKNFPLRRKRLPHRPAPERASRPLEKTEYVNKY
mgnify:CR=1 FL=1